MLHITNGDCVSGCLRVGGVPGDMVAWCDVLHEGPVPAGLSHAKLSKVRAEFIASRGWCNQVRAYFGSAATRKPMRELRLAGLVPRRNAARKATS